VGLSTVLGDSSLTLLGGDGVLLVASGLDEAVENVVRVGSDDELVDGETHALGEVTGQDVTKVSGGDDVANLGGSSDLVGEREVGREVVDDLGEDTGPVDGVNRTKVVGLAKNGMREKSLDNVLAVVESSLNGQIVDVVVENSGHLGLLDGGDLALGVKNENGNILLSAKTVNGSGAGVSTGSSNNSQGVALTILRDVLSVLADKEVLEEVSDKLERNVLESEGRTVEELHDVEVVLRNQVHNRRDVRVAEGGVRAVNERLEILGGDLIGGDVKRENLVGKFLEAESCPCRLPASGERGNRLRDEKTTVRSKSLEYGLLEGELCLSLVHGWHEHVGHVNIRRMSLHENSDIAGKQLAQPLSIKGGVSEGLRTRRELVQGGDADIRRRRYAGEG
jgi:hypothetical protein